MWREKRVEGWRLVERSYPCPRSPPVGVEPSGAHGGNVPEYWGQLRTPGVGGTALQMELGRMVWGHSCQPAHPGLLLSSACVGCWCEPLP